MQTDPAFQEAGAGNVISQFIAPLFDGFQRQFIPLKEQVVDHILEFYFKLLILFKAFAYFTCFSQIHTQT
jgi:hypothetical protein